jgi:hypothetical protein
MLAIQRFRFCSRYRYLNLVILDLVSQENIEAPNIPNDKSGKGGRQGHVLGRLIQGVPRGVKICPDTRSSLLARYTA